MYVDGICEFVHLFCEFAMISNIDELAEFKDSFVGTSASFSNLTYDGGSCFNIVS